MQDQERVKTISIKIKEILDRVKDKYNLQGEAKITLVEPSFTSRLIGKPKYTVIISVNDYLYEESFMLNV